MTGLEGEEATAVVMLVNHVISQISWYRVRISFQGERYAAVTRGDENLTVFMVGCLTG